MQVIGTFPEDTGTMGELEEIRDLLKPHLPKDATLQSVFCEAPVSHRFVLVLIQRGTRANAGAQGGTAG